MFAILSRLAALWPPEGKGLTDLLALVNDVFCEFVTFPFSILGQVWYLIVSILDPCCLFYLLSFTPNKWCRLIYFYFCFY